MEFWASRCAASPKTGLTETIRFGNNAFTVCQTKPLRALHSKDHTWTIRKHMNLEAQNKKIRMGKRRRKTFGKNAKNASQVKRQKCLFYKGIAECPAPISAPIPGTNSRHHLRHHFQAPIPGTNSRHQFPAPLPGTNFRHHFPAPQATLSTTYFTAAVGGPRTGHCLRHN